MSVQPQYADALGKTQEAVAKGTELWAKGVQTLLGDRLLAPLSFDPAALIDPVFDGVQTLVGQNPFAAHIVEINRSFATDLLGTFQTFQGVVREHTEALIDAMREQVGTTADIVKEQTAKAVQVAQEPVAEAQPEPAATPDEPAEG